LESGRNEIHIDPRIGEQARLPIERMLAFAGANGVVARRGALTRNEQLTPGIGPA